MDIDCGRPQIMLGYGYTYSLPPSDEKHGFHHSHRRSGKPHILYTIPWLRYADMGIQLCNGVPKRSSIYPISTKDLIKGDYRICQKCVEATPTKIGKVKALLDWDSPIVHTVEIVAMLKWHFWEHIIEPSLNGRGRGKTTIHLNHKDRTLTIKVKLFDQFSYPIDSISKMEIENINKLLSNIGINNNYYNLEIGPISIPTNISFTDTRHKILVWVNSITPFPQLENYLNIFKTIYDIYSKGGEGDVEEIERKKASLVALKLGVFTI
jgi:hypothetical protein